MRFGLDVSQHQLTYSQILERVKYAEDSGFEGAWIFDHFTALYGDPAGPCLEAWTLLGALAAATEKIRLGTLVTGITHRHPSVLATEIVTVDQISGGRLECGLGGAWNEEEHRSLGIPFPPTRERLARLEEAIEVIRRLTTGERVSFDGRYYQLDNARYRPRPVQTPHPPIWIGANGMKRSLPLVGRQADAWHGWSRNYAEKWKVVREAALQAGRDPQQILRSSSLSLSAPWDKVRSAYERLAGAGVQYLVVEWPTEGRAHLEEFVTRVMPTL